MAKINHNDLTRYKKLALIEYSEQFMKFAQQCETVTTKMTKKWLPLKSGYDYMVEISQRSDKSDLTDPIHVFDSQQDGYYTSLWHAVNAQRKSAGETGAAATSLWNTLNSFKVHTQIQYQQELAEVDRLIAVIDERHLEAVETLGLLPIYNLMKQANAEIHRLIDERYDEESEKPDGKFAEARSNFTRLYNDFVEFVNAYQLVEVEYKEQPDEALATFIRLANITQNHYNNSKNLYSNGGTAGSGENSEEEKPVEGEEEQPTPPAGGSEEEQQPGEGEQEQQPTKYTITYMHEGQVYGTQEYEAGAQVTPIEPPEGYAWLSVPSTMPARNVTCTSYEYRDPNDI